MISIKSLLPLLSKAAVALFVLGAMLMTSGAARATGDFDVFKDSFKIDTVTGVAFLDEAFESLMDDFGANIQQVLDLENLPGFVAMDLAACEALKSEIVKASPINPFKIPFAPRDSLKSPFCEGSVHFGSVVLGTMAIHQNTHLGAPAVQMFARIFKDYIEPKEDEQGRVSIVRYFLNARNEIVEISTLELVDIGSRAGFPEINFSLAAIGLDGSAYSIHGDERTGTKEYFYPADATRATVSRITPAGAAGSPKQVVQLNSFRPEVGGFKQSALVLTRLIGDYGGYSGERLYSVDGTYFIGFPNAYSVLQTKSLNGREICTLGTEIIDYDTRGAVRYPTNSADRDYCEEI